ncbi:MAG TPA: translocation/assembly module TamB domain-containing protein, partial [Vicinamibacterales bacterium]|nr:translocation/assembly module TamB domain-containing protein [Vicinamibacterales bacterium]
MLRRATKVLARIFITIVVIVLIIIGAGLATIETAWAKNRIRGLIVSQANEYLTATLDIGELSGSLVRGLQLRDVRLARDGKALIAIDEIALSYSIRELLQPGTVIRRIRLTRPRIEGGKQRDGRWDLAALVKREQTEEKRSGPGRPIEIQSIEIVDGRITLRDPLQFGAAHVPTDYQSLNASLSFEYYPVRWRVTFDHISWVGRDPTLDVTLMTGSFGHATGGWFFDALHVESPHSAYTLRGHIDTDMSPTRFDLQVRADAFAFQEWSGVLNGLKNIAVDSSFDVTLKGSSHALDSTVKLTGTGGSVAGRILFDTSLPGWHGKGSVDVTMLNLARWLNRADRPSNITGRVTFDLDLGFGIHFPRGTYTFDGPYAMYMNYAADDLKARGRITAEDVMIAEASAVACGAHVTTVDSTISLAGPFPFRFRGAADSVDLRFVPAGVPVPHVESTLGFDYDVHGRFSSPFVEGNARFRPSTFLGARIGAGTLGSIDTSQTPITWSGDGDVDAFDLHRVGEGLDVGWMQDPRYAGTIAGHFRVEGAGSDRGTLAMTASGRIFRASLFKGTFADAVVSMAIDRETLRASYDGRLDGIDPAIPFDDTRLAASLTGTARMTATVRGLLTAPVLKLGDYDVAGTMALAKSTVGKLALDRADIDATLRDSVLTLTRIDASGPSIAGVANGRLDFREPRVVADLSYDVSRADLEQLRPLTGGAAAGIVSTKGHVSGPSDALHAVGDASATDFDAPAAHALTVTGHYDVTTPSDDLARTRAHVNVHGSFLTLAGGAVQDASGIVNYEARQITFNVNLKQVETRSASLKGALTLLDVPAGTRALAIDELTISIGSAPWQLAKQPQRPTIQWTDAGVSITAATLTSSGNSRIDIAGDWRRNGSGILHVTAGHVSLDTLQRAFERPALYGGVLDVDATIRGGDAPSVTATVALTSGRVERVTFQQLRGRVDYADRELTLDLRLDQAPGVWISAVGTAPLSLLTATAETPAADAGRPIDLAVTSSRIDFGLIEGVTDVLRSVSGDAQINVRIAGTARDPHFTGTVSLAGAAFLVAGTGSRYKNASADIALGQDRITVNALHLDDAAGHQLRVTGSIGTRELTVGDVRIDVVAQRFEIMRNEFGRLDLDASLQLRGTFDSPRVAGDVTIDGTELHADEILQRVLFRPYAEEAAALPTTDVDAVAALNPWDRLGLDVSVHVPRTLRLTGKNVQVSANTPIGIGDIDLHVGGDLYLYKDSRQPLSVTGSLDTLSGAYVFQGRRFDVDEGRSSINFHGDLDPDLWVRVRRLISGVDTSVTLTGPLHQPELQLASTPPLDSSDILSLIVFNTSTNQLNTAQQQELLVRAGALAAGFLAGPLLSTIQSEIGIQTLEIDPGGDLGIGPKVTVGEELAPGLVARFSRQFGPDPYDEVMVEYYLSRILR